MIQQKRFLNCYRKQNKLLFFVDNKITIPSSEMCSGSNFLQRNRQLVALAMMTSVEVAVPSCLVGSRFTEAEIVNREGNQ